MEKRNLYDDKKNLTNKTYYKDENIPVGYYFLVVVIFIQNNNGEFLIQKRSQNKDGKWATTGGHPKAGESSLVGLFTEVKEEIGLDITDEKPILFKELKDEDCFCDLYYLKKDIAIDIIICDTEEVEKVKWATIDEINTMFKRGIFKKSHYMMFQNCLAYLNKKNNQENF